MKLKQESKYQVGVVLGSASDLDKVEALFKVFDEFEIGYELAVISAHRTPELLEEYARSVYSRGFKVLIAAAGLSAALPGMLASLVHIPVIGLPISAGTLNGIDALLSISQMPPGVPVACVGIDSPRNAGLLAVRILSLTDCSLAGKLSGYRKAMAGNVVTKMRNLKEEGYPVWEF
ncbi:MAG TPA: 5-(carboxyamino)imidazole ribonucleotide mutase [Firmicutes bacterium]|nr:5-(carboxyamino)imidazole ribonucleotide mutase [Candidatus Fermentithermobacillaceae bacterium]